MGATPTLEEIEALARAARLESEPEPGDGADPPPVGAPVAANDPLDEFGLTSREREVLMLMADGRSNAQIVDELVISRRTASVHVSNILGKLGVATRVVAAALVHRRGGASARRCLSYPALEPEVGERQRLGASPMWRVGA
jgi:DNA-binding NarL/FixJ family response regulator